MPHLTRTSRRDFLNFSATVLTGLATPAPLRRSSR